MATYLVLDIVCSVLVVGGIVGALVWSIATQHRDHGCEEIRLAFPRRTATAVRRQPPAAIRATVTRETA